MSELPAAELEIEVEEDEEQDVDESSTDNVGDPSVEINVEELINEIERESVAAANGGDSEARRRLDEIMERKRLEKEMAEYDDY